MNDYFLMHRDNFIKKSFRYTEMDDLFVWREYQSSGLVELGVWALLIWFEELSTVLTWRSSTSFLEGDASARLGLG